MARRGQPQILDEANALLGAEVSIGLFVDHEDEHAGLRAALAKNPRCAYGSWTGVRNLEEAVATWLPWAHLSSVVGLAAELRGRPEPELLQQVGEAIGRPGSATLDELRQAYPEHEVRKAVSQAMQSKNNPWFKTLERGRALGARLLDLGLPTEMAEQIKSFWTRILEVAGWRSET